MQNVAGNFERFPGTNSDIVQYKIPETDRSDSKFAPEIFNAWKMKLAWGVFLLGGSSI